MTQRRFVPLLATLSLLALAPLGGCPAALDSRRADPSEPEAVADAIFPVDYSTSPSWEKLTREPIYRKDVRVAREIYGKLKPDLGVGTILVKEEYQTGGVGNRAMAVIGVMRRTGEGPYDGWSFEAYDPVTHSSKHTEVAACIGCHTLQKDDGYRFAVGYTIGPIQDQP